ncbi:MAG: HAD family hydrolase [Chloroflexi bacterium]|nr:HAD family hydrolase [Chloroflexota bacterium]
MTPPTVVLWDVDGTLVRSNGGRVSVSAFLRALREVAELEAELPYPKDSGGKTDEQIALEVLISADLAEEHAIGLLPSFRQLYLRELEAVREQLVPDLRVLPGVREALEALRERGVTQTLLTGNLQTIARLKLTCAGLADYVDFGLGAYGSDHRDRTCLVPITRQRLRERLGTDDANIVVVGDTPRDIACARAGGARAIAVATGNFPRQALMAHAPDALLDDLQDTEAVVATLLQQSPALQLGTGPSSRAPIV